MKKLFLFFLAALFVASCSHSSENQLIRKSNQLFYFEVENPSKSSISGVHEIILTPDQKRVLTNSTGMLFAKINDELSPFELSDNNADGITNVAVFQSNIPAGSSVIVSVFEAPEDAIIDFEKKTQAELWHRTTGNWRDGRYRGGGNFFRFDSLRVPDGFTDHTYFIKYEGPGWESDRVGYRMYLDWRNANDVFGKKVTDMVLQDVGVDGFESYHHMDDWGMDVLKVGRSLGIGSIGWFDGEKAIRVETTDSVMCKIEADGLIRSQVKLWYYGWETGDTKNNLISLKTIDADSRMTREFLKFENPQENVCTGFIIENGIDMFEVSSENGEWKAIASWGQQSLAGDDMGLAVLYPSSQNGRVTRDALSHLVVFEKPLKEVEYYFLAAWEQEPDGITTLQEFKEYLRKTLDQLEEPLIYSPITDIKN
ncbi:DUF4861 family protein [Alkalitalea saponilacus]|uniref:DUF4861 domain-containing protein n=1 Tax=Alkalitalea saponilacus TaxID=889453 RepID=A0A1T5HLG2_9BACT|nr:DUF4861 family protein [Alkalitalea saponilacus]ASB47816.1 DUF4861 domain-containing protein [Alkalitalea saponilacus]SKC21487.1 protein of unknown function [Alkalitalea saponilacus]